MPVSKSASTPTRFYPQRKDFASHQQWDALRRAWDEIYKLQDAMTDQVRRHEARMPRGGAAAKGTNPNALGSGLNTQVAGMNVSGSPTANGQTLKWNSATGQLEWQ